MTVAKIVDKQRRIECCCCGRDVKASDNYYKSSSPAHAHIGYVPQCRECIKSYYHKTFQRYYPDTRLILYYTCRKFDIIYYEYCVNKIIKSIENKSVDPAAAFGYYMKYMNSLYKPPKHMIDFETSDTLKNYLEVLDDNIAEEADEKVRMIQRSVVMSAKDQEAKSDVLRILGGRDPFPDSAEYDQQFLYNAILPYLEDSQIVEDEFRLRIVCTIVKTFLQIKKTELAIDVCQDKLLTDSTMSATLDRLMKVKASQVNMVNSMAKDNGISLKYKGDGSMNASQFSGLQKRYNELNIADAETNLIDQKTAASMKRVADISNRSIVEQLCFDNKDLEDMFKELREKFVELQEEYDSLFEENRELKKRIDVLESE